MKKKIEIKPKKKVIEKKIEVETPIQEPVEELEGIQTTTSLLPQDDILEAPSTEPEVQVVLKAKEYPIPVTREDLLALHKCLKDLGVNSIGDLEVRASKL